MMHVPQEKEYWEMYDGNIVRILAPVDDTKNPNEFYAEKVTENGVSRYEIFSREHLIKSVSHEEAYARALSLGGHPRTVAMIFLPIEENGR
ncbi:MAG: hypothetical protein HGA67_02000 [Candidatus Yonathbacteria bacterium]|nr:hypothetical protein [Candidatus Yonathbacteria bacterium]